MEPFQIPVFQANLVHKILDRKNIDCRRTGGGSHLDNFRVLTLHNY